MEYVLDYYQKRDSRTLKFKDDCNNIEISEVLTRGDYVEVKNQRLENANVESWLDGSSDKNNPMARENPLVRVVFANPEAGLLSENLWINERVWSLVTANFGLPGLEKFVINPTFTLTPLPLQPQASSDLETYGLLLVDCPKFAWCHDTATGRTDALCWGSNRHIISHLQDAMASLKDFARHPMYLHLVFSVFCGARLRHQYREELKAIGGVETVTKHTSWDRYLGPKDVEDEVIYAALQAKMSASAGNLAQLQLSCQQQQKSLSVLRDHCEQRKFGEGFLDLQEKFNECLRLMEEQLECYEATLRYETRLVNIQLTALTNLSTQQDHQLSISVADSSRALASATKDDSTAMKTLAAVTVVFLPSTFVAALFSMPLFQWDTTTTNTSSVTSKQFWIYWAVSIPLTVVTMVAWFCWNRLKTRRRIRLGDIEAVREIRQSLERNTVKES